MSKQQLAGMRRRRLLSTAIVVGVSAPAASISQTKPSAMQPQIDVEYKLTENRDRLVALLKEGTGAWISTVPGFVSSSLHVSRGGQRRHLWAMTRC